MVMLYECEVEIVSTEATENARVRMINSVGMIGRLKTPAIASCRNPGSFLPQQSACNKVSSISCRKSRFTADGRISAYLLSSQAHSERSIAHLVVPVLACS